ncbi:MAG: cytochrome c [Pseudomonadota bacterium]
MRLAILATVLLPLAATVVVAQTDPIKLRKDLMKQIGDQTDIGAKMLKGETPFDPAKAAAIFKTFSENGAKFGALFPAGSDTGDTKATAAIWSDRAGFDAALAHFNKAVADNAANVGTESGFKTAFAAVAEDCRSCHRAYKAR